MEKQCQHLPSAQFCTTFAFLRQTFAAQRVGRARGVKTPIMGQMLAIRNENLF